MKNSFRWMTLAALHLIAFPALADRVADAEEWSSYVREEAPAAPQAARPAYPPEVAKTLTDLGISLDAAPAGAGHPEVSVDKYTQTISISAGALNTPWVRKVSTGGGLKIPNGEKAVAAGKKPYCASTPDIERKFIPAIQNGDNPTMERVHYSDTFAHDGHGSEMPWAIRIEGGIFFHEAPGGKISFNTEEGPKTVYNTHLLGHNVSGECVRLDAQTARLLYGLALKYGGINAAITGDDPEPVREGYCDIVDGKKKCFSPNYCDEDMRLAAEKGARVAAEKSKGGGGFGGWLTSIFGGSGSSAPSSGTTKKKSGDSVSDIIGRQMGTAFSN